MRVVKDILEEGGKKTKAMWPSCLQVCYHREFNLHDYKQ